MYIFVGIMKTLASSLLRALCAIAVGALLVKYREQTVEWITIAIGVLFFVSGVFSCATYFVARGKKSDIEVYDADDRKLTVTRPVFPIVGLGSLILGIILTIMPMAFVSYLMYLLAAILILGAVSQFVNLIAASRIAHIGLYFWVMPALTLLVGLIAIISPTSIASAPLFVIGWTMIVYGVVEMLNAIKIYQLQRFVERNSHKMPTTTTQDTANDTDETEKNK